MEIRDSLSNISFNTQFAADSNSQADSLRRNLSRTDLLGLQIDLVNERKDRNARQDLLRASLSFKSSVEEMSRMLNKAKAQSSTGGTASTSSSSDLALSSTNLPIDQVPELSNISSGTYSVNGVSFSLDITTDSLDDVISDINSSSAGVTAAYDSGSGTFSLTSDDDFVVSNGNTKLFATLQTSTGAVKGAESAQQNFFQSDRFVEAFQRFAKRMGALFSTIDQVKDSRELVEEDAESFKEDMLEALELGIKNTLDDSFTAEGIKRLDYGMTFFFDEPDKFLEIDGDEFTKQMSEDSSAFVELFSFDSDVDADDGLLLQLNSTLTTLNESLVEKIGPTPKLGYLVDIQV